MTESLTEICKRLEHFETPEWAARAILKKEILTSNVYDPCCGSGVLCEALLASGYEKYFASDIHNYGYKNCMEEEVDFLSSDVEYFISQAELKDMTVFMNPPFSKAVQFVERAFELGARKIVCFQRFAWWESKVRREFWQKHPPNRIYICSDRADCWRHDIPADQRGSGSPTAHAWFVWEQGHPAGTILGHISKADAA